MRSPIAMKAAVDASAVLGVDGDVAGVQASLPVRLRLLEAHGRLTADDVEGVDDGLSLHATVATGLGRFELTHQGRGLASKLAQLREQQLGVRALDDAFIVRCDDDGFALLRRLDAPLLALLPCPHGGRVVVGADTLTIAWSGAKLDAIGHLWEALHAVRIGG